MSSRRYWTWILLLGLSAHLLGISCSILPAQDGLKFLRIAREFQTQPWADVIRNSDQHPLYPALIALFEPAIALALGRGPDAWRIAAQLVSAFAAMALLLPLYHLGRALFDEATARLAVLLFVLLPGPASIGHDTLSDSLALFGFTCALCLGEAAIRKRSVGSAAACGIAAGCGFWVRPEVAVLPVAVGLAAVVPLARGLWRRRHTDSAAIAMAAAIHPVRRLAVLAIAFLALVGTYAMVKGEVSEKLALRRSVPVPSQPRLTRRVSQWLPRGLDDARWDFSPKEESARLARIGPAQGAVRVLGSWAEAMGWLFAPLAVWGAWRVRAGAGRYLVATYAILFGAILVRHAMSLGYLSDRHALTLVVATIPWAAAGMLAIGRGLRTRLRWDDATARRRAAMVLSALVALGLLVQSKPAHASRWGHRAAGRWLATHARPGEAVLDTRGWASFVSGRGGYDYWHVRQALTDTRLTYVVVGADELAAPSRRAATLRAILACAGEPVAALCERADGGEIGVWIYRFHRPESWEGVPPMSHGSFWDRLVRGTRWAWFSAAYRDALPVDLADSVMALEARDRHHAKQGRSTARVRFDSPAGPLAVYLKRHVRLPIFTRLAALIHPAGRHTPAKAEWVHLERVRALGIAVPEVVAAGEQIGPWGALQSFLMVAELTGCRELNEALPELARGLARPVFARLKREIVAEMAKIAARLHRARLFHKDFYLCHFFIAVPAREPACARLTLIDLHRLGEHHVCALRWRWKDLAQLLYSTYGVEQVDDRDRLRFWMHYRRRMKLTLHALQRSAIRAKAARYLAHGR